MNFIFNKMINKLILFVFLNSFVFCSAANSETCPYDGVTLTNAKLKEIISEHTIDTSKRGFKDVFKIRTKSRFGAVDGNKPLLLNLNLCGALVKELLLENYNIFGLNLSGMIGKGVIIQKSTLEYSNLSNINASSAIFIDVKSSNVDLSGSNFSYASFSNFTGVKSNFKGLNVHELKVDNVAFIETDLRELSFKSSTFFTTHFVKSNLSLVKFTRDTVFDEVYFELTPNQYPDLESLVNVQGLNLIRYLESPSTLLDFRDYYNSHGFRDAERVFTFNIKRSENNIRKANIYSSETPLFAKIEYWFNHISFDLTVGWGLYTSNALLLLFIQILFFSGFYFVAILHNTKGDNGIWKVWDETRVHDTERGMTELLSHGIMLSMFYGYYFSLLSSFRFGWKEYNIGEWIARMQSKEFTLKPTGIIRFISTLQSVISLYLLSIWIASYFGRPFG